MAAFSLTQIKIVGYIGISELVMLLCGPFVLVKNWAVLRRDGFTTLITMAGLWALSAVVSDWYRQTSLVEALKGMATPLSVVMIIPCTHALLSKGLRPAKWAIVGFAVTLFLSTFVIQSGTSVELAEMRGITAREAAINYKLTYMTLVISVAQLIPALAYLKYPNLAVAFTVCMAIFCLFQGGRSTFLALMVSVGMMAMVGGRIARIRRASSAFIPMIVVFVLCGLVAGKTYKYAATHGLMGEEEQKKYEMQASSKIGILSGRYQVVAVYYAVRDSPLLGHGSWAIDYRGYGLRAAELVNDELVINAYRDRQFMSLIPGHSHIFTAYVWHGLLGAAFWVYVLLIVYRTLRYYLGAEPEFFGLLALTLPSFMWSILFSPFGARISETFLIVLCLFLRRTHERQLQHATMGGGPFVPAMRR